MVEEVLAIALAIVAIAASIAVAVLVAKLYAAHADADHARADLAAAVAANKGQVADKARLESVITDMKAEIAGMEKDLDACSDPSIVRDRLRGLLASPSHPASTPALSIVPRAG